MIDGSPRSEAGATLVEVLVAVMVLGIAFVALIGGFGVSIASSDLHRKQAIAETAIRRYAEAVKQVSCTATGCPGSYTWTATGFVPPNGFTADNPVCIDLSSASTPKPTIACPTTGIQGIRVSIKSTDNRVDANLELVKRPG